jgi:hypothetical protein
MMQLRAFATYLSRCETFDSDLKLVLMGGMRNAADEKLVQDLKAEAVKLDINVSKRSLQPICHFGSMNILKLFAHFDYC